MTDAKEPHKRFRLRRLTSFSLRTALIAMTVLAVWLGLHMNSVRKQRAAIEAVERRGGSVQYDFQNGHPKAESPVPVWLLNTLGKDHFHSVVSADIRMRREANDGEFLRRLQDFPKLEKLSVGKPLQAQPVTDSHLKHIGELTSLRVLLIRNAPHVTSQGVAHLANLYQLERLLLNGCQLTGDSLRIMSELPNLEELWLEGSRYADGALKQTENMTQLRELMLGVDVRDSDLVHLKQLTQLETLGLQYSDVTETGLRHLVGLSNLRFLWLGGSQVKDASWLQERLPNCRIDL